MCFLCYNIVSRLATTPLHLFLSFQTLSSLVPAQNVFPSTHVTSLVDCCLRFDLGLVGMKV
jgi:hypothetical protein